MANNIIKVAVHDLQKTDEGFAVVLGQDDLPVNATTQRLVDTIYTLYNKRSSKSHGVFSDNKDDYPTEGHLEAYVADGGGDFAVFTSKLMTTLQLQAQRRPGATGGFVFFSHFERDGKQYLLVSIVNNKLSASLTDAFDVEDVEHLDLDGFRFAGRINLTAWAAGDGRYLGFLKGKGNVSDYFKEFLGCTISIQEKADTRNLVDALLSFADSQAYNKEQRDSFLSRAKEICDRSARDRSELSFEALANELTPDEPNNLLDVLVDPEMGLNDSFIPHRGVLGTLVRFKAQTPLWTVEFERGALAQGAIKYDPKENSITIPNIPADLAARLRAEHANDE